MNNIIYDPKVYLVGEQKINDSGLQKFLDDEGVSKWTTDADVAGEKLVETAGRLCYMSFSKPRPGGNRTYIEHILEVGHGSVLEHSVYNLIITGVSRSFTHELIRHRSGFGYSQLSQRFVNETDCDFVVPPALRAEVEAAVVDLKKYGHDTAEFALDADTGQYSKESYVGLRWLESLERSQKNYKFLSDYIAGKMVDYTLGPGSGLSTAVRKASREAARSVLPNATETKIFVTANARALRHFLEMRGDKSADAEIRRVAIAIAILLKEKSPNIFGDYEVVNNDYVTYKYKKV